MSHLEDPLVLDRQAWCLPPAFRQSSNNKNILRHEIFDDIFELTRRGFEGRFFSYYRTSSLVVHGTIGVGYQLAAVNVVPRLRWRRCFFHP